MALYRCLSGGGTKTATGTFTWSSSNQVSVNIGFKPKYLCVRNSATVMIIYNQDLSTTSYQFSNNSQYSTSVNFGTTTAGRLYSISDSGFTVNKFTGTSGSTGYYFAIG